MDKVHELLHQQTTETPFFIIGKAFFGKKDISQKDGSYTATLWMTFFNIPFYPIDSYRILNTEHNLLPKVYGLGEYILIRSVGMKFDLSQVIWTFIVVYGSVIIGSYINIYLFIEYSRVHGLGFLAAVIGTYASILVWNHKTLNASPRVEGKHSPKIQKTEPAPVVVEEIQVAPMEEIHIAPMDAPVASKFVAPEPVAPQPIEPKPAKRSLESIVPPAPKPVIKPQPVLHVEPVVPVREIPAAVHIEVDNDEPKFELAPSTLDKHIKAQKPTKKAKPVEHHEASVFNPIPKPVMAVAESQPAMRATISEPVKLPNQVKFDPNKIMEWNPADIDMNPAKILYPHDHMQFADWMALLVVVAMLGQLVTRFYFLLYPNQTGDMLVFQNTFDVLYDLYFLSLAGVVLFLFTVRNSPYLAYPLLFLAFAYFFRLEEILYKYLLSL